jgi:hypothetical protein
LLEPSGFHLNQFLSVQGTNGTTRFDPCAIDVGASDFDEDEGEVGAVRRPPRLQRL